MSKAGDDLVYPEPTAQGYQYFFHPKHHGAGSTTDCCWKADVSRPEEFGIFRDSAERDVSDEAGNLYGLRKSPRGSVIDLGTRGEQIAQFWNAPQGSPWHGFPCWSIITSNSLNRKGQQYRPPKEVFIKMQAQQLLTASQCQRLKKGASI